MPQIWGDCEHFSKVCVALYLKIYCPGSVTQYNKMYFIFPALGIIAASYFKRFFTGDVIDGLDLRQVTSGRNSLNTSDRLDLCGKCPHI